MPTRRGYAAAVGAIFRATTNLVVVTGSSVAETISVPRIAGTISWEILAGLSARVPRVFSKDGRVTATTTLNERTDHGAATCATIELDPSGAAGESTHPAG